MHSAAAIATFGHAAKCVGSKLHKHPQPALCHRIRNLSNSHVNKVVKIKGHDDPYSLCLIYSATIPSVMQWLTELQKTCAFVATQL